MSDDYTKIDDGEWVYTGFGNEPEFGDDLSLLAAFRHGMADWDFGDLAAEDAVDWFVMGYRQAVADCDLWTIDAADEVDVQRVAVRFFNEEIGHVVRLTRLSFLAKEVDGRDMLVASAKLVLTYEDGSTVEHDLVRDEIEVPE